MKSMKQQGFTLIELIVVIVILGILSATALPKFFDLSNEARAGVMGGVEAAMRSADTMIYAKSAAAGTAALAGGAAVKVVVNGNDVLTHYGYAASAAALRSVLTLNPDTDFTTGAVATDGSIQHSKAKNFSTAPDTCAVVYVKAADANTPPTYTLAKGGC